uniref:Uncharacterized protein n=1 Tax=Rhizophora mucronata TaxID=61149 RepID=A0A2P2J101_RHIMU
MPLLPILSPARTDAGHHQAHGPVVSDYTSARRHGWPANPSSESMG